MADEPMQSMPRLKLAQNLHLICGQGWIASQISSSDLTPVTALSFSPFLYPLHLSRIPTGHCESARSQCESALDMTLPVAKLVTI
jgi:hypothetical protein